MPKHEVQHWTLEVQCGNTTVGHLQYKSVARKLLLSNLNSMHQLIAVDPFKGGPFGCHTGSYSFLPYLEAVLKCIFWYHFQLAWWMLLYLMTQVASIWAQFWEQDLDPVWEKNEDVHQREWFLYQKLPHQYCSVSQCIVLLQHAHTNLRGTLFSHSKFFLLSFW